ncbi:MAG: hypothetical protein HY660_15215 [Armatimonadetes bacterium]|nr:hypothetical protein [Armatimonadota bacterium]
MLTTRPHRQVLMAQRRETARLLDDHRRAIREAKKVRILDDVRREAKEARLYHRRALARDPWVLSLATAILKFQEKLQARRAAAKAVEVKPAAPESGLKPTREPK